MNPVVEIIRLEESEQGTFGVMKVNKEVLCFTLEPKDMENASNISSIPAQQYICKRIDSPGHGDVFEVKNVPGRTHVLIHPGNTSTDTLGCILPGEKVGELEGKRAVLSSGKAFYKFMERMQGYDSFHLTIQEVF